jgi:hypothetical protein
MDEVKKEAFYCHLCEYKSSNCTNWLKHVRTQKHLRNGKPKSSKCNLCDYETSSHWNLKLHMLSQHSNKEEREKQKYYCEICDLVFFCNSYKNKHLNGKIHKNRELCFKFQNEINLIEKI